MNPGQRISGVLSPVITPFDENLRPDAARFVQHCQWLVSQGAGLAVFGTNSEANSMSVSEKLALLDNLIDVGVPAERMMPGTGCSALTDSVEMTRHAVQHGVAGVLMLPPFYYKGVSDDGLFASYAEIIERVGDDRLKIYLYHIPQVSQVPISLDLIERLLKAYPGTIAGIKDSSGDWTNTEAMLKQFQPDGFDVFCGSESFLLATLRGGGKGCITATGNVNPGPIVRLFETWQQDDADQQQANLDDIRNVFQSYVMIAALKAATAHFSSHSGWARVRPPLVSMTEQEQARLISTLEEKSFTMPGLQAQAEA